MYDRLPIGRQWRPCKAFDKVPHRHLLYKLDYYGIRGTTNQWIASLLTGRMHSCREPDLTHYACDIRCPQGLGPGTVTVFIVCK